MNAAALAYNMVSYTAETIVSVEILSTAVQVQLYKSHILENKQ